MSDSFLQPLMDLYAHFDGRDLGRLDALYHPDVEFADPFHQLRGRAELKAYLAASYKQARQVEFEYGRPLLGEHEAMLRWRLHFRHPRLKEGRRITVPGVSHVLWNERGIFSHADFYDGGALLYENVPVLGRLVRVLKGRMQALGEI